MLALVKANRSKYPTFGTTIARPVRFSPRAGPMGSQYNYICAGVIITIIPALIIFLLCQDQIYSGMAAGAVKE